MQYLAIKEIAERLNKSERRIRQMAQEEGWESRQGQTGLEYSVESIFFSHPEIMNIGSTGFQPVSLPELPETLTTNSPGETLPAVMPARGLVPLPQSLPPAPPQDKGLPVPVQSKSRWNNAPQWAKDAALDRLNIVKKSDLISAQIQDKKERERLIQRITTVHHRTISRWKSAAENARKAALKAKQNPNQAEVEALLPLYGSNKGKTFAWSPEAIQWAAKHHFNQSKLTLAEVYYHLVPECRINGWKCGSIDSLRDALNNLLPPSLQYAAREGFRKWEAKFGFKILRDYKEIPPGFCYIGDHHIFDVIISHEDRQMRPWITAWMDMRTRAIVGYYIGFDPSSQSIGLALRHAILPKNNPDYPMYGLPSAVYIDNGKDYKCQYLNGEWKDFGQIDYPDLIEKFSALGVDPAYIDFKYDEQEKAYVQKRGDQNLVIKGMRIGGVFSRLGITAKYATAYHPWAKTIERTFRELVQNFSRMQRGWCGSNPQERPEKLKEELKYNRLLAYEPFCANFKIYLLREYHQKPQSGHGMDGFSPNQVWRQLANPETVSEEIVDFALLRQRKVKVYNWGFTLLGVDCELLVDDTLEGAAHKNRIVEQNVEVLYSPDYKTIKVIFDGKFWCLARPWQRESMINPGESLTERLKQQSRQRKLVRGQLKELHASPAHTAIPFYNDALPSEETRQIEEPTAAIAEAPAEPQIEPSNIRFFSDHDHYVFLLRKDSTSPEDAAFMADYERTDSYERAKGFYESEREYQASLRETGKGGMQ